jgi:hypothetical protein
MVTCPVCEESGVVRSMGPKRRSRKHNLYQLASSIHPYV